MFCAFEHNNALLVLFELTPVPPNDLQELDYVLIHVRLGVGICALDLAFQISRALAQDEGVRALLVLFEEGLPLLRLGDICCHRNTSPGLMGSPAVAGVGYAGITIVGRLMSLIAFAISGPPLFSFWVWFAIASTDF